MTGEQRDQERRDFGNLALNELQLERHEAHRLHDLMTEQVLKGHGGTEVTDDNSDDFDERAGAWSVETRRRLREVYGDVEAARIEAGYKAYIDSVPGFRARLVGGIAAHPDVALPLVRVMRRVGRRAV